MTVYLPSLDEKDLRKLLLSLHQLGAGRSNATGTVTLAVNVATTTVSSPNCTANSTPILTPTTANAATEIGNGTMYVSSVAIGSFIITHANAATTGRTFLYALLG